jgi:hypothetical protein
MSPAVLGIADAPCCDTGNRTLSARWFDPIMPQSLQTKRESARARERERPRAREKERECIWRCYVWGYGVSEVLYVRLWCQRAYYYHAQLAKNTCTHVLNSNRNACIPTELDRGRGRTREERRGKRASHEGRAPADDTSEEQHRLVA